ncbi:MAG: hypothetical protein QNJ33_03830 [Crocosphaera sp.]|nr:hypothetical protein [Crocosphaera sp.]
MSNVIIELLTLAVIVMALRSNQSQEKPESVMIRVPVKDEIRRS